MATVNTTMATLATRLNATAAAAVETGVGSGDAVWILTSAFIIFTMISGFGLVESGQIIHIFFSILLIRQFLLTLITPVCVKSS